MRTSEMNDAIADLRAALAMLYCLEHRDTQVDPVPVTDDESMSDTTVVAGLAADRVRRVMKALEDDSGHGEPQADT